MQFLCFMSFIIHMANPNTQPCNYCKLCMDLMPIPPKLDVNSDDVKDCKNTCKLCIELINTYKPLMSLDWADDIYKQIKAEYSRRVSTTSKKTYRFHMSYKSIKSIMGVNCFALLTFMPYLNLCLLDITTNPVSIRLHEHETLLEKFIEPASIHKTFNFNTVVDMMVRANVAMQLLTLDKRNGRFVVKRWSSTLTPDELLTAEKNSLKFMKIKELEFIDVCSVCLCETTTQSKCGHNLCVACKSQLKTAVCPECRESLANYSDYDDDDDDDEDDATEDDDGTEDIDDGVSEIAVD